MQYNSESSGKEPPLFNAKPISMKMLPLLPETENFLVQHLIAAVGPSQLQFRINLLAIHVLEMIIITTFVANYSDATRP